MVDVGHGPEHYGYRARMRLLALRCGDIRTDPGLLLDGRRSEQTFDIPVMTHAVDTGDGVLLWDTGMNARCLEDLAGYLGPAMASTFEPLGDAETLAPARLQQAGFSDDDVRWIVNSHLHFDHCGCNSSFPPGEVGDPGPRSPRSTGASSDTRRSVSVRTTSARTIRHRSTTRTSTTSSATARSS